MPLAVIVAFHYVTQSIPSISLDVFRVYSHCRSLGCSIHLLSDMERVAPPSGVSRSIAAGLVPLSVLSFSLPDSSSTYLRVRDGPSLRRALLRLPSPPDRRLFFYYSGHGVRDCILAPDQSEFPTSELRDLVLRSLPETSSVFWVLDCCNPDGLLLPFGFEGGRWRLRGESRATSHSVLLLTSGGREERAVATEAGSLFTRLLFDLLREGGREGRKRNAALFLPLLREEINRARTGFPQTVSLYSSFAEAPPVLWNWLLSPTSLEIKFDPLRFALVLSSQGEEVSHRSCDVSKNK